MLRIHSLGRCVATLAFALFSTAALTPNLSAADKPVAHTEHDKMYQECAKACSDCQRACDMCVTHCAHELHAGKKEHMATLAHCADCSSFCAAASQIVARGGPMSKMICASCGDCCAKCAAECEKIPGDEHMKACAAECRRCETVCKAMAK